MKRFVKFTIYEAELDSEVCGNTLRRHAIDPNRHLYRVDPGDIVRSGLMRLATLQSRGYVYIKP